MGKDKKLICSGVSFVLTLVAFFMFLATFITYLFDFSGYDLAFADKPYFGPLFSWIVVLLAMLISLCAFVVELLVKLNVMKPLKISVEPMVELIVVGVLALFDLLTVIFLFLTPAMCNASDGKLGAGAVVAAIMMLLALFVKCAYVFLPKLLKK